MKNEHIKIICHGCGDFVFEKDFKYHIETHELTRSLYKKVFNKISPWIKTNVEKK